MFLSTHDATSENKNENEFSGSVIYDIHKMGRSEWVTKSGAILQMVADGFRGKTSYFF